MIPSLLDAQAQILPVYHNDNGSSLDSFPLEGLLTHSTANMIGNQRKTTPTAKQAMKHHIITSFDSSIASPTLLGIMTLKRNAAAIQITIPTDT